MLARLVLAPSDLRTASEGDFITLGGRVAGLVPLRVADAFDTVTVEPASPADAQPGDLVVVEGRARRRGVEVVLAHAEVETVHRPPASTSPGEWSRLVSSGRGPNLRLRAEVIQSVRAFFAARGFLEVDTPSMVPSPGLDLHLDAFAVGPSADDASGPHLVTSPEYQMKRLLSAGVPRMFQLARCFRRGERGDRHNPEFVMIELYRAFSSIEAVMADTEALVREVVSRHAPSTTVVVGGHTVDLAAPFDRLTVTDAFSSATGLTPSQVLELAARDETTWFRRWVDEVEPAFATRGHAVFVHDFPLTQASLARRKPGEPALCERFELYVGDLELCNGFGELTDPAEQRARLLADQRARGARGKPVYAIDERFLRALEEGMPPSAGNAVGLDRLVALCAGTDRIADVMPFPADWL